MLGGALVQEEATARPRETGLFSGQQRQGRRASWRTGRRGAWRVFQGADNLHAPYDRNVKGRASGGDVSGQRLPIARSSSGHAGRTTAESKEKNIDRDRARPEIERRRARRSESKRGGGSAGG